METNTENVSYEVSVARQKAAALTGHFAVIAEKATALEASSRTIQSTTIDAANLTREIGQELQFALNKQQLRFEEFEKFFRDHAAALPGWLDSKAAHKLITAAKKFPEPITDLKSAMIVLEDMTFFAVGLMEEPKRTLTQTAQSQAPLEKVIGVWSKLDETLTRFKEEYPEDKWDRNICLTMLDATRAAAQLHERCKQRAGKKI